MKHLLRKHASQRCPTCYAEPYKECYSLSPQNSRETPQPEREPHTFEQGLYRYEAVYLEYLIFNCIHRLRELRPNHLLVKAVESVTDCQVSTPDP